MRDWRPRSQAADLGLRLRQRAETSIASKLGSLRFRDPGSRVAIASWPLRALRTGRFSRDHMRTWRSEKPVSDCAPRNEGHKEELRRDARAFRGEHQRRRRRGAGAARRERRGKVDADQHPWRHRPAGQRRHRHRRQGDRARFRTFRPREGPESRSSIRRSSSFLISRSPKTSISGANRRREPASRTASLSSRNAREAIASLELDLDAATPIRELSTARQQMVEIVKAISQDARILVMDEPTSSLSLPEVERLFAIVRRLKKSGVAIIYISHRLEEIFARLRPGDGDPRRRLHRNEADRRNRPAGTRQDDGREGACRRSTTGASAPPRSRC